MPQPYALDVLKVIDVLQNLLAHMLTLQEMYQEGLGASEYDRLRPKFDTAASQQCGLLRIAVENPVAFAQAVAEFQSIVPKTVH
jgi:hypothetical protein